MDKVSKKERLKCPKKITTVTAGMTKVAVKFIESVNACRGKN